MTRKSVLLKVQSRHDTTNLYTYQFPKLIYYSKSIKQQSKRIKCVHKHQDEKQKGTIVTSIGRFQIHSYGDQQTTGQGREN